MSHYDGLMEESEKVFQKALRTSPKYLVASPQSLLHHLAFKAFTKANSELILQRDLRSFRKALREVNERKWQRINPWIQL